MHSAQACTYRCQTPDSSLIIMGGAVLSIVTIIIAASQMDVCTVVAQDPRHRNSNIEHAAATPGNSSCQLPPRVQGACRQHPLRVSAKLFEKTMGGPASSMRGAPAIPWRSASRFGWPTCRGRSDAVVYHENLLQQLARRTECAVYIVLSYICTLHTRRRLNRTRSSGSSQLHSHHQRQPNIVLVPNQKNSSR
jgi:hypothetical protein